MSYIEELFSLKDKNAIVTGAASGLGQRCAWVLAKAGARVVLADKNKEGLQHTAETIKEIGGESLSTTFDVSNKQSITTAVEEAISFFQQIHILVNCAGIFYLKDIFDISESDWDRVIDTNLKGSWLMGQQIAKHMADHRIKGSIINISSATSTRTQNGITHYSTSKAGLNHLTRNMSFELAKYGIRVNTLEPGGMKTAMVEELLSTPEGERIQQCIPLKRMADLHELDGPLLLLASEASSYMTGSMVTVDGGLCCNSLY